jgi:hypothetical protein
MELELEYVDSKTCDKMHGNNDEISDDMICAATKNGDSCSGDSGGPLIIKSSNNYTEDRLVGLVSWGRGCANENFPGVYARISYFYDWIVETTCYTFYDNIPPYINCATFFGADEPSANPSNSSTPSPSWIPSLLSTELPSEGTMASNTSSISLTNVTSSNGTSPPSDEVMSNLTSSNATIAPSDEVMSNITYSNATITSSEEGSLQFVGWSETGLDECQGDCDTDNDCIDGLICMKRDSESEIRKVPGCAPSPLVTDNIDICYDPSKTTNNSDYS